MCCFLFLFEHSWTGRNLQTSTARTCWVTHHYTVLHTEARNSAQSNCCWTEPTPTSRTRTVAKELLLLIIIIIVIPIIIIIFHIKHHLTQNSVLPYTFKRLMEEALKTWWSRSIFNADSLQSVYFFVLKWDGKLGMCWNIINSYIKKNLRKLFGSRKQLDIFDTALLSFKQKNYSFQYEIGKFFATQK